MGNDETPKSLSLCGCCFVFCFLYSKAITMVFIFLVLNDLSETGMLKHCFLSCSCLHYVSNTAHGMYLMSIRRRFKVDPRSQKYLNEKSQGCTSWFDDQGQRIGL